MARKPFWKQFLNESKSLILLWFQLLRYVDMDEGKKEGINGWKFSMVRAPLLELPERQEVAVSPERSQNPYNVLSPLGHSYFRTLWQGLRSQPSASREDCLFPLASRMLGIIASTCPLDKPLPGPGQNRGWGRPETLSVSCQVFKLYGAVNQPQKTGSISRRFLLPFSCSWDLRIIQGNVLSLSLPTP